MNYGNTIVIKIYGTFENIPKMKQMDTKFSSAISKKSYGNTFFHQKNKFKSIFVTLDFFTFLFGNFIQLFNSGHFKNVHFQKPNPTFKNFDST